MVRRAVAFLIDYWLTFLITFALVFLSPQMDPAYLLYPSIEMFSSFVPWLGVLFALLFPIFRDVIFGGASLGKRIMRLRIVVRGTDQKPSFGVLILRNLTIAFVSVEFIVWLVTKGRRLGDFIGNTDVISK